MGASEPQMLSCELLVPKGQQAAGTPTPAHPVLVGRRGQRQLPCAVGVHHGQGGGGEGLHGWEEAS